MPLSLAERIPGGLYMNLRVVCRRVTLVRTHCGVIPLSFSRALSDDYYTAQIVYKSDTSHAPEHGEVLRAFQVGVIVGRTSRATLRQMPAQWSLPMDEILK
jgi:hypothetical protein